MKARTKKKKKKKSWAYLSEFRLNTEGASRPGRFATLAQAHPPSLSNVGVEPSTFQRLSYIIRRHFEFVPHSPPVSLIQPRELSLQHPQYPVYTSSSTHLYTYTHTHSTSVNVLSDMQERNILLTIFMPSQSRMRSPSLAVKNTL